MIFDSDVDKTGKSDPREVTVISSELLQTLKDIYPKDDAYVQSLAEGDPVNIESLKESFLNSLNKLPSEIMALLESREEYKISARIDHIKSMYGLLHSIRRKADISKWG
ncbi:hypothetical protein HY732_01655 [Candidatus Uhrbacteria bacterium]|nr:hypothetical protein [Candidatus Uhrbacteria bacterium]